MNVTPPTTEELNVLTDHTAFALGARYGAYAVRQRLLRMLQAQARELHELVDDPRQTFELVHQAQTRRGCVVATNRVMETEVALEQMEPEALLRQAIGDMEAIEADAIDGRCEE